MLPLPTFVLFWLLLTTFTASAQRIPEHLNLNGTVLGYTFDDTKSLFKKKKIEIEGSVAGASIRVTQEKTTVNTATTNAGGEFQMKLPLGKKYTVTYFKKGYGTSAFELDLRNIPEELTVHGLILENIELILNNYESDKPQDNGASFGRVYFQPQSEIFAFKMTEFEQKKRLFKKAEDNTAVNLMLRALDKNESLNKFDPTWEIADAGDSGTTKKRRWYKNGEADVEEPIEDTLIEIYDFNASQAELENWIELKGFEQGMAIGDVRRFKEEIALAKEQLAIDKANAVTELDFLNIAAREKLLLAAERELANAEMYIAEQADKIKAQQNSLYALIGLAILLAAFGFYAWRAYKQKKKTNAQLAAQHKKITDSIHYALKIQRSVLLKEEQIKALVPKSLVYYQPLDTVSGDFYWFSKIDGKLIIAAVDCTGHGVPGAFMSLIGNTLMNQIVNEKRITEPAAILTELHHGIVASLNQYPNTESAQDGMDLAVCTVEQDKGKLVFAGAMNAMFIIQDGELNVLDGSFQMIGGYMRKNKPPRFKTYEMDVKEGDRLYLFSDGFMDQFGYGSNETEGPEKYNVKRFKELILAQNDQDLKPDFFEKALKNWKGELPQTDDILVIGVEL